VPLVPVPDAPEVITNHAASEVALQPQTSPLVVTLTEPVPPAALKESDPGDKATVQSAAP
jgi:hypothetical protein